MTRAKRRGKRDFEPMPEQLALVPDISGNALNGRGESRVRRPTPIYWHDPEILPHGPMMLFYYEQNAAPEVTQARTDAAAVYDAPLPPQAETRVEKTPEDWSACVRRIALDAGAGTVGIARVRPEWVFEGYEVDYPWMVVMSIPMDFEVMCKAPSAEASVGVLGKYAKGTEVAKETVRGDTKWYVDFDKCILYFNENFGCAICLAVCPWSHPGVAPRLAEKLVRRKVSRGRKR